MSGDVAALLLIFGVHLIALAIIVGPLARSAPATEETDGASGESDEDGGGGSRRPHPARESPRPRGDLPLPDAAPARLRLRGPGRLADAYTVLARRGDARRPAGAACRPRSAPRDRYTSRRDGQGLSQLRQGPGVREQPQPLDGRHPAPLRPEPPEGARSIDGAPRRVYVCTRCLKAGKVTKAAAERRRRGPVA